MTDYIFNDRRDIDAAHLSNMLQGDEGAPKLEIKAYYAKDHRPRGLKVSVYRTLETSFGSSYDIMNRHNGLIHLADMPRKPSAKVAAQWASLIADKADEIAAIALESESPDWAKVKALFQEAAQ